MVFIVVFIVVFPILPIPILPIPILPILPILGYHIKHINSKNTIIINANIYPWKN